MAPILHGRESLTLSQRLQHTLLPAFASLEGLPHIELARILISAKLRRVNAAGDESVRCQDDR